MLLSFRVANSRSFLEEQELLLLPAYDRSRPAVPVAAIYGANASGKSNLLAAIDFMRRAVLDSFSRWSPDGGVPRDPFAFAAAAQDEESRFGVDLLLNGEKYVYGFAVTDTRVTEEWLYHHPRGRRRVLFERETDDFRFGDTLRGPKTTIEEVTRPNSLFLSAAAHHGLEQIRPVHAWFSQGLRSVEQDDLLGPQKNYRMRTLEILQSDSSAKSRLVALLKAADFGVIDITTDDNLKNNFVGIIDIVRKLPPDSRFERFKELMRQAYSPIGDDWMNPFWNIIHRIIDAPVPDDALTAAISLSREVLLVHNTPEGPVALPIEKESKGTRTWFNLLGLIIDALDHSQTLVIDELDTSLHPLLMREIVRLFQDYETNPDGAQLVFTTHDTSLLARHKGEEGLRRDEVWFTEKTRTSETRLYPLTDFKPRQGLNWERRYLGGSVGAVPFLEAADFAAASDGPPAEDG